jgi:hypothetical protein
VSGPRTIAEAAALNEVPSLLSGGLFMGGAPISGDTICLFLDADGQQKGVHCIRRTADGPDEWVKVPFRT